VQFFKLYFGVRKGFGKEYLGLREHKKCDGNNFMMKMRMLINSRKGDKIINYVTSKFVCDLYNKALCNCCTFTFYTII
jgi:hypothetical protein